MSKIREIITEPSKMYVSEIFRVKIKAIRYLIYREVKDLTVSQLKQFTVSKLKGD